jgi:hypothetical protein
MAIPHTLLTSRAKPQSHLACLSFTRRRSTRVFLAKAERSTVARLTIHW